jgi:hypothetical protein
MDYTASNGLEISHSELLLQTRFSVNLHRYVMVMEKKNTIQFVDAYCYVYKTWI